MILLFYLNLGYSFVTLKTLKKIAYSSYLKMGYENELGVLPPVGFFDPLGLSKIADEDKFRFYRSAELKHGRVSMLAVTGYIVQEQNRLPGYIVPSEGLKFTDVPNGIAAFTVFPFLGWLFLIGFVGFLEYGVCRQTAESPPGDFGYGYFTGQGIKKLEGNEKISKLNKELQNGRLAMLAIMELLTHDIARPTGEGLLVLHHF